MNPVDSATFQSEPAVGMLHVVDGARVEDALPCTATLAPPRRAARGRAGDRLFVLLDLVGPASTRLYRELREVVAQTYWATTGSITAGLRQAAAAANRHLFDANLHSAPSDRCEGGLISAVLHGDDLFVLQAGCGGAWLLHGERLERFSCGEDVVPLGIGPLANVRLDHTFVALGDTLLLASYALSEQAGVDGLGRVLVREGIEAVLDGLEQVGSGVDFAALLLRPQPLRPQPLRRAPSGESAAPPHKPREELQPAPSRRREFPQAAPAVRREPPRESLRPKPAVRPKPARRREPAPRPVGRGRSKRAWPKPAPTPGTRIGRIRTYWQALGGRLATVFRAAGRGVASAGTGLAGGLTTLFQRMLPGPQARAHRESRPPRPIPNENRAVMMGFAIGLPLVLSIAVALAYLSFGAEARVEGFIRQAQDNVALAQAAGDNSEEARLRWQAALDQAQNATRLRPNDPVATELRAQARAAIDLLDGILRLQSVRLWNFGSGTLPRRLVVRGQMAFVLDPAGGWVDSLTLPRTGEMHYADGDGVAEQGETPILVQTGQEVDGAEVGSLVGCTWTTSSLLILEQGGGLIAYDPAWVDQEGTPRLTRSFLATSPVSPKTIDSYASRLYVLDTGAGQIWRYEPRDDTYPNQPTRYFVTSPPKPLAQAVDMAIDGNIYVLYEDGEILQFLQGERQTGFVIRGVPDGGLEAVALAVDPEGNSGAVYVADVGKQRVVVLGPDGSFRAQLRTEEAFDALEALAVDEAAGRLYVISGGSLYSAVLPNDF